MKARLFQRGCGHWAGSPARSRWSPAAGSRSSSRSPSHRRPAKSMAIVGPPAQALAAVDQGQRSHPRLERLCHHRAFRRRRFRRPALCSGRAAGAGCRTNRRLRQPAAEAFRGTALDGDPSLRRVFLIERVGEDLAGIVFALRREEVVDLGIRALQLVARIIQLIRQEEPALVRDGEIDQFFRSPSSSAGCLHRRWSG